MRTTLGVYDEGIVLYGAARVARGGMPYRDFWTMYGPGSFYLLAGLDKAFGESVLVGRVLDAVCRAGVVGLLYALLQRQAGRVTALIAAVVAFLILLAERSYLFPALPATTCALLTLSALAAVLRRPAGASPWAWVFPGAAAGATFLFRPDFGVCALAGCLWALLVPFAPSDPVGARRVGTAATALLAGTCAVVAPLFGWLISGVSAADLFDNLIGIPMQVYVANRELPFPPPLATLRAALSRHDPALIWTLAVYLPPLVLLGGTALAVLRRRARRSTASLEPSTASGRLFEASLVILALLCIKGSVRVQVLHMLPALMVAVLVAVWRARTCVRKASAPGSSC